jgi:hypothetical protein
MRQLIQQTIAKPTTPRNAKWAVYMGRKEITQVYFDPKMTKEDVLKSLIDRDGMAPTIKVFRVN